VALIKSKQKLFLTYQPVTLAGTIEKQSKLTKAKIAKKKHHRQMRSVMHPMQNTTK